MRRLARPDLDAVPDGAALRAALETAQAASDALPDTVPRTSAKNPNPPPTPADRWDQFKRDNPEQWAALKALIGQLAEGQCAYCNGAPFAQVEHHWPKAAESVNGNRGTPRRMFDYGNLLPSCATCNGFEYKGSRMEWRPDGSPLLPDPASATEDAGTLFSYQEADGLSQEFGRIDPVAPDATNPAGYAIRLLGLNTRRAIREARGQKLRDFLLRLAVIERLGSNIRLPAGASTIGEQISSDLRADQPHLGIIRFWMRRNPDKTDALLSRVAGLREVVAAWNPDILTG